MPKWLDSARGHVKRGGWRSDTTEILKQVRDGVGALVAWFGGLHTGKGGSLFVRLTRIEDKLDALTAHEAREDKAMALVLSDILTKVRESRTVEDSAAVLLAELKLQLDAAIASGDPAMLQQISDEIDANKAALGAAIVANTPAATVQ